MMISSALTSAPVTKSIEEVGLTNSEPLAIHTCGRLGRTANPPRSWFAELFRPTRRR
jgi:hypothetical protein